MKHAPLSGLLVGAMLFAIMLESFTARGAETVDNVKREPWLANNFQGSADPQTPYTVEAISTAPVFSNPVELVAVPGGNEMLAMELAGKLRTFTLDDKVPGSHLAADLAELPVAKEVGKAFRAYGFAFHPDFLHNSEVFICYALKAGDPVGTRVSRFRASSIAPLEIDLNSEQLIVSWMAGGHNGGSLHFGPEDGYLYISTGDAAPAFPPDTFKSGQDVSDLLASVLRIDVSQATGEQAYSIPPDNPFVSLPGARGEIWTYGHRNPWKMSFDYQTGDLWIGDVGWEMWEMIYRAAPGANFGWSIQENNQPVHPDYVRGPTPITPPAAAHPHTESRSITGGYVYRGTRLKKLAGTYVYGDYVTGKIWGFDVGNRSISPKFTPRELANTSLQIVCFGVDQQNELYIVSYDGTLHRLIENPVVDAESRFPNRLSETGLFNDLGTHQLSPGVIPYDIIAEPWADGTLAERFIALPGQAELGLHKKSNVQKGEIAGEWSYPEGAVLGKTILLEVAPGKTRRLETQLMRRHGQKWEAYSYVWNDSQNEAVFSARSFDQAFAVADGQAAGSSRQLTYHFSSRTECQLCHTSRRGTIYGFRQEQLNRDIHVGKAAANQLRTMAQMSLFSEPLAKDLAENAEVAIANLPRAIDPRDDSAPIEERARAYLHLNCATCHCRGGGGSASIELVENLSLEKTHLVSRPTQGTFGIVDPWIVAPGDPFRSVLYYRMSKLGRGRMPHFGSQMVDPTGSKLIHDWIAQMEPSADSTSDVARRLAESDRTLLTKLSADHDELARNTALDQLLASPSGAARVARAIVDGQINGQTKLAAVHRGGEHQEAIVRDLFEPFLPEESRQKRLGTSVDTTAILALEADLERGRALFFESTSLQCRNCHKVAGQGKEVGPNLDGIGKRLSRGEILVNILDPSRRVDPKYQTWIVQTGDGEVFTGVKISESPEAVVLRNSLGADVRILVGNIDIIVAQQKSIMPELLLRDTTPRDAADLLRFLESLK